MNIKEILSKVAPFLASMIGGPFAAAATKVIANTLLGKEDAPMEEIQKALLSSSPEQLIKLKQIDAEYKLKMTQLGLDELKTLTDDRNSARNREVALQDKVPAVIAILLLIIFSIVFTIVAIHGIPDNSKSVIQVMFGTLAGSVTAMISYYFGSSHGSSMKNFLLSNKVDQK